MAKSKSKTIAVRFSVPSGQTYLVRNDGEPFNIGKLSDNDPQARESAMALAAFLHVRFIVD